MCGFLVTNAPTTNKQVVEYLRQLEHRGPDSQEYICVNGWTFCFTRLAITDLSTAGNQPFYKDGKVLVFNGEIYNHEDLRRRFGFDCNSSCDTEVLWNILNLFGLDGLKLLDGMYSFVYIDFKDQTVLVGRDRFGQKPFFYTFKDDCVYFCSEINPLLSEDRSNKPDLEAFANYIVYGEVDNSERTFFDGICQLLPGESAGFSMATKRISKHSHKTVWDTYSENKESVYSNVSQHHFDETVSSSVSSILECDVKSGLCLSGGIDSSVLLALSQNKSEPLNLYTFEFADYSELEYVKESLRDLGTTNNLTVCTVTLKDEEMLRKIQEHVTFFCAPSGSLALVGMEEVYKAAKSDSVKVLFNGAGADELWMGYTNQLYLYLKSIEGRSIYERELVNHSCFMNISVDQLRDTIAGFRASNNNRTQDGVDSGFLTKVESGSLIDSRVSFLRGGKLARGCKWIDHLSMQQSIEVRLPYLSEEIFQGLFPLDPSFCLESGMTKAPLRKLHQKLYSNNSSMIPKMHKQHPQHEFMRSPNVVRFMEDGIKELSNSSFGKLLKEKELYKSLTSQVGPGSSLKAWVTLNTIFMYKLYFSNYSE